MSSFQELGSSTIFGMPLAFLWMSLVIELTPGPNMTYLAVLSATEGRRAGLSAVIGIATGLAVVGLLAALGVAATIANSKFLYGLMRWGGVLYLAWLAYGTWTGATSASSEIEGRDQKGWIYFKRGLITNLLNPKAAVFYIAVLPLFVSPDRPVLPQTLVLTVAYVGIATAIHSVIAILAGGAREFLENEAMMAASRRVAALAIGAVALWFLWSTSPAGP